MFDEQQHRSSQQADGQAGWQALSSEIRTHNGDGDGTETETDFDDDEKYYENPMKKKK